MNHTEITSLETLYKISCKYKEEVDLHILTLVNAAGACSQCMGNDEASAAHAQKVFAAAKELQRSSKKLEELCAFTKKKIDDWYRIKDTL